MFKLKFISALLSCVLIMSSAVEAEAIYISRNLRDADLGMLDQQQINRKEADIAFTDTGLSISDINIVKSGSTEKNKVNLTLSVDNNSFVQISQGQDAGGWIPLLPEGARAYVARDVERGDFELTLALEGVASSKMDEYIEVGIPSAVLVNETEGAVVSDINFDAPWAVLSSDYEVITPDEEAADEETEIFDREATAKSTKVTDDITPKEADAIKEQLFYLTSGRSGAYREIELTAGKHISSETLDDIYAYVSEAGRTDRQLSNVCLVFTKDHEDGAPDYRMYVPFKNLRDEGKGIDASVIRDEENTDIKAVSELFAEEIGKEGEVILVSHNEDFGSEVGIITRVSGRAASNRYKTLYFYDEEAKSFSKYDGKYEIDATGYLHFFTEHGGFFVLA